MKKTALLILSLMLMATVGCSNKNDGGTKLQEIKDKGVITMATSPDFGPYEFMDLNKTGEEAIVGCDVELGKFIASEIGVDIEIVPMDFKSCQAAVSVGKVDFSISGYAKTPEREESMECSDTFLWEGPTDKSQGLIVLKENADLLSNKDGFAGKKIGAQNGSLQVNLTESQLPDAQIEFISSINDGVMMLLNGKIDALASSYETGEQFCKNYDELIMSEFVFEDTTEDGNVVLAPKGETALMDEINKAIKKAKDEGYMDKWLAESKELCDSLGIKVN
ncbi:MAG: transporter substrate-binding domain-containing protein [Eubacteriales bacterium]|nr:transporter substrate-binding domain-containing protein [Eubacteriales bacterium]